MSNITRDNTSPRVMPKSKVARTGQTPAHVFGMHLVTYGEHKGNCMCTAPCCLGVGGCICRACMGIGHTGCGARAAARPSPKPRKR